MKTLVERLISTGKATRRTIKHRVLPIALAINTLVPQIGYGFTNKNVNQDASYADSSTSGEIYGPEIPAGFGYTYGPPTPEVTTQVSEHPKQRPSIENMNIDSVDANYRFQLSMNWMKDGDEKRLIIAQYYLAQELATPKQLAEIETIDVSEPTLKDNDPKGLERLNQIFHDVFLRYDPNRETYENEFITKVLADRVKYAGSVPRTCFHNTDNSNLSVVIPVWNMLDDLGKLYTKLGYLRAGGETDLNGSDMLGYTINSHGLISEKTFEDEIYEQFPDDPKRKRRFIRNPSTHFAWMEPTTNPEIQRAKSESGIIKVNVEDSIPHLNQEDAALVFLPVPDLSRTNFRGDFYLSINPKPFVVKSDSGKRVELTVKTFVHGPDKNLVARDSTKKTFPIPSEGFSEEDRYSFVLPTPTLIYSLGKKEGTFQYSAEIFTLNKTPEKWDNAGSVWIRATKDAPEYFGYVADEKGSVQVPSVGQRGDSLKLNFFNQLVSYNKDLPLPTTDSTGAYPLEYVVNAYPSAGEKNFELAEREREIQWPSDVLNRIISEIIQKGRIPKTYERDVLVKGKVKRMVNGRIKEGDTLFFETQTFNVTDDQRRSLENFLPQPEKTEKAVFIDTLFGYMNSTIGEHKITIPLPDSVFQEGKYYDFSIEVNPRDHSRLQPRLLEGISPKPISYQAAIVKNVKIVKKIPGKTNKK